MGGDRLVLLIIVVEFLQLHKPIHHSHCADDHEQPIDSIGGPPVLHEPEKIIGPEQVVDE